MGFGAAFPPRILNMTVPQVGQRPLIALRPFFMVSSCAFEISFLALHLTQYPSGIKISRRKASCPPAVANTLRVACRKRQGGKRTAKEVSVYATFGVLLFKLEHRTLNSQHRTRTTRLKNDSVRDGGIGRDLFPLRISRPELRLFHGRSQRADVLQSPCLQTRCNQCSSDAF